MNNSLCTALTAEGVSLTALGHLIIPRKLVTHGTSQDLLDFIQFFPQFPHFEFCHFGKTRLLSPPRAKAKKCWRAQTFPFAAANVLTCSPILSSLVYFWAGNERAHSLDQPSPGYNFVELVLNYHRRPKTRDFSKGGKGSFYFIPNCTVKDTVSFQFSLFTCRLGKLLGLGHFFVLLGSRSIWASPALWWHHNPLVPF